jgi:hypothetical protein
MLSFVKFYEIPFVIPFVKLYVILLVFAIGTMALDMDYIHECVNLYPQGELRSMCVSCRFYESLMRDCQEKNRN